MSTKITRENSYPVEISILAKYSWTGCKTTDKQIFLDLQHYSLNTKAKKALFHFICYLIYSTSFISTCKILFCCKPISRLLMPLVDYLVCRVFKDHCHSKRQAFPSLSADVKTERLFSEKKAKCTIFSITIPWWAIWPLGIL